jgi:uncharacterized membrane protein YedE/YeeE
MAARYAPIASLPFGSGTAGSLEKGALMDILPDRIPWYVAGPLLGLLVVGLYAVANQPLGASGAYVQASKVVRREGDAVVWRAWYFAGIFIGGMIATLLGNGFDLRSGYEPMRAVWPLGVVIVVVAAGAVVMGYGARMAGGCTSGHGICGTAQRSPASWVATGTFMATAVVVTLVLRLVTGGDL